MLDDVRAEVLPDGLYGINPRREPVFHAVSHDGAHWIATLNVIKRWGDVMRTQSVGPEVFYAELYVGMPDETGLKRCDLGLAGTSKKPKVTVSAPGIPGVLWTCDL